MIDHSIFEKILSTNSITAIEMKAEDSLAGAVGEEKDALERILEARKIDEIYAICNEMLGRNDEAQKLRDFIFVRSLEKRD